MSHDAPTASPYRKVSICTWGDKKVRKLSPVHPSGQALFLMLLVGPQTTNIPGLQPIGRMAFAEMLDWEPEAFDEAFAEAFREGLVEADWKARVLFVPNAIKHNLPQSPNVVKSWASTWSMIPECDLKVKAWNVLYAALLNHGKSYADAFLACCPTVSDDQILAQVKPTGKASGKPTGKPTDNQEQEQEQEQDNKKPSASASPPADCTGEKKETSKTFRGFVAECKANDIQVIPANDGVFKFAEKAGIPREFVALAWVEFRSRYADTTKRYRDWPKVFRNAVRDNWFKLWFCGENNVVSLTNQGRLIQKAHKGESA